MAVASARWATCKSAPRSRQITTPAPHHSVLYRPDALPAAQPTASKHRRQLLQPISEILLSSVNDMNERFSIACQRLLLSLSFYCSLVGTAPVCMIVFGFIFSFFLPFTGK